MTPVTHPHVSAQAEHPLSKMLGTKSMPDFLLFQILDICIYIRYLGEWDESINMKLISYAPSTHNLKISPNDIFMHLYFVWDSSSEARCGIFFSSALRKFQILKHWILGFGMLTCT
jgi:hypothetical protein